MAEPLKHLLNDGVPPRIAAMLKRAWRGFDTAAFLRQIEPGSEGIFSAWDAMLAASVAGQATTA